MKKSKFKKIHFTSTLSISLVMFLVGMVLMLLFVANDISTYVKENINLSLVLKDGTTRENITRIENYLTTSGFSHSVEYISKEAALKDHIHNLGENPQEFLGYNPLKASMEVKLSARYANNDSVQVIQKKLGMYDCIDKMAYQKDIIGLVDDNVKKISVVLLGLAAVLLFVSIALINNTIRLSLYANRFLINTMKLVGATPSFIRIPYMKRSMLNGLFASIVAIIILLLVVIFVQYQFAVPNILFETKNLILVSLAIIIISQIITSLSSYFTVQRFVKMNTQDLHNI